MIYITGDTHGNIDINKLSTKQWKEQKNLTKNDYLIILGDFGICWDNGGQDAYLKNWYKNKPFTTLFIDGNHENFDILNSYPIEEWNGGKVHKINDSIIHLMRGQIYNIDGYTFFTMGGATSIDRIYRKEHISWWKEELPNNKEYQEAENNLKKANYKVDYILTHCTSSRQANILNYRDNNELTYWLNDIEFKTTFKHWFFGHYHEDINMDDKHTCLYNKIIKIT